VTFPTAPVRVPDAVAAIAAGRPVHAVWQNELGGVTFSVADGSEFVKVYPDAHAALLTAEAERLTWAHQFAAVPRVLSAAPGLLHTAGLPGRTAFDPYWVARPDDAARAIGEGLRRLHDTLPVDDCPFATPSSWAADGPPVDRLVVCHGDACVPNTLIGDDGRCSGHVDVGDLGLADRWADLAVAILSMEMDFTGNHEAALLDAYGVAPDRVRIAHYRRRWEE
jgi:kanamycin kinase